MLKLQCKITLEHNDEGHTKIVSFDYVNSIEVKTSVKDFTDTAIVKIPRKMSWRGKNIMDFIKRNDAITIQIGYSNLGNIETVFKGYVNTVENTNIITINCENIMRRFKMINVNSEIIDNFDITTFIHKYAPEVNVVCPEKIDFGKVTIASSSLSNVLDKLHQEFEWFKGYFCTNGDFVVITNRTMDYNTIILNPERNIIRDTLKYTLAEDIKVKVKLTSILPNNKKIEVVEPANEANNTEFEQRHFYSKKTSISELKSEAKRLLYEYKEDKMEGTVVLLGVPFISKGDVVKFSDKINKERDSMMFVVDEVNYKFSDSGYNQVVTLGYRLKK